MNTEKRSYAFVSTETGRQFFYKVGPEMDALEWIRLPSAQHKTTQHLFAMPDCSYHKEKLALFMRATLSGERVQFGRRTEHIYAMHVETGLQSVI